MLVRRTFCAGALGLLACIGNAQAQGPDKYPSRPIRIVVPNTAGATTDLVARLFADRLTQRLGQPVTVDNKPGAGGTIAAQAVAKAPPDGYSILLVNSQHVINPSTYESLPYDTLRDFAGVALVGDTPSVIAVPAQLGVRTLGEFVALAKSKPGALNYASGGVGSQTHLSGALFVSAAGISLLHVPYRSATEVLTDLVSNRVNSVFAPAAYLQGQIQAGKLMPLAVTGSARLPNLRDVPTVGESGYPGYEFTTWIGLVAPAKVPAPLLAQLSAELKAITEESDIRKKYLELGLTQRFLAPKEFDGYIKAELERLAPVVKASGVKEKP